MASVKFQTALMNLQGNLLNFAYMLTSNRDDAYDLLQETTLKALDNEEKYADNINFKGWIFTIMRNIFINNYRRNLYWRRGIPKARSSFCIQNANAMIRYELFIITHI